MTGIYLITCKTTFVGYVGQSRHIEKRWYVHHKRFSPSLFNYQVLEECNRNSLDEREKHWIAECQTIAPLGFNLRDGGQGDKWYSSMVTRKGTKLGKRTKETKMNMTTEHVNNKQLTCPHCSKSGQARNMYRWHFNNCRNNNGL
jgi:hypothetical protein